MGYYTNHILSIVESKTRVNNNVQEYINNHEEIEYGLGDSFGENEEAHKWYTHEDDMKELSKNFIDTLFLLEGEGEEGGDLWKEYYRNGKMQRCDAKLTYDDFDEDKLI